MQSILIQKKIFLIPILSLFSISSMAQQQVQTLRGVIIDQQSKNGIDYATVSISGTNLSTTTDSIGTFIIKEVPLGRIILSVSHVGYEPRQIQNVVVVAGKETVLEIEMLESLTSQMDEVVIVHKRKITSSQMATVSASEFNAEDTRRFAGSRNDVARMASNFAGVNSVNDGRNDIIIRGNSPLGLLWRLEGVDIPNPNHFGSLGLTGGPVGMLNNNVIGQSAFYTGAFPAQFGNATSGVFDVYLRKGNANKREFTAQVGFNGLELGAEGPFSKKSKASYLVNYRYSIPGLIKSLGVDVGTGAAVPAYQDISLKIDLPTKKAGQFTLFGMGGNSNIDFKGNLKDTINFYNDPYHNLYNKTKMGVAGIKHTYFYNNSTSSVFTLAATGSNVITRQDSLDVNQIPHKKYRENGSEWRYVASFVLNKKFSAKDRLTAGITADRLHFSYKDSIQDGQHGFIPVLQENNHTHLFRGYAQWQHRFNSRLTLNTGVYSQHLALNNNTSVDGRAGIRYTTGDNSALTFAYGGHSQMQALMTYFHETRIAGTNVQTNRELGFTKSQHLVAGWEQALKNNWKYKLEAYGQYLYDVPVEQRLTDWSVLNVGAGYGASLEDSLVNKGKGYNYGLELTVEKPFANGYYFLGTGSLFNSKYEGSNGVEHNTVFNGNYVVNALSGKEWAIGEMHTVAIDFKGTVAGGKRYTPIDEAASLIANDAVYIEDRSFELQSKPYLRMDIKLTYRMNNKKFMQEFFVDFQNVTNTKNMYSQWYDNRSGKIRTQNQLGFYPNFNYRIQF
ncbi:MAG: TonB-dependent receptor [Flavipsychrobacter sp.]|nr:TonB-dependent receptor [Flavipsychrobacter sp.]